MTDVISHDTEIINKVLDIVDHNPKLDYKYIYDYCQDFENFRYIEKSNRHYIKNIMWQKIRDTYSTRRYKKFLEREIGVHLDDLSELEQIFKDNCL